MKQPFQSKQSKIFALVIAIILVLLVGIVASTGDYSHLLSRLFDQTATPITPKRPFQIGDKLESFLSSGASPRPSAKNYAEIRWDDLIPDDWDPVAIFKNIERGKLKDDDPIAIAALENAKKYWQSAPVKHEMNGRDVKIAGFVVSLDRENEDLKEFLLVPYFGSCIHVPPPPINQIIYVNSLKAAKNIRTMGAVWVSGRLTAERSDTALATSGYTIKAESVEPFRFPD